VKLFSGHRPENGIEGRATVIDSCGGLAPGIPFQTLAPLVVDIVQAKPYLVAHRCNLTRKRYPIPGDVLQVVVDADHPLQLWVDWDQLKTIDERLADGDEVFTNPDAARKRIEDANKELVYAGYAMQDEQLTPEQAKRLQTMRDFAQRTMAPSAATAPTAAPTVPTARVLANSANGWLPPEDEDEDSAPLGYGEILLSVLVPGKPRYGARWRGIVHRLKDFSGDIPVRVDEDDPSEVHILWDEIPGILQHAAQKLKEDVAAAKAKVEALPHEREMFLPNAVADPAMRAQMIAVMKQAGAPQAEELERLNALHESGVLNDEEFAAETRRFFGQT
jgi:hypothetical protein